MKKVLLHALCCALTTAGLWLLSSERTYGQASQYTYTVTTGTYAAITGTSLTASNTSAIDDQSFSLITLPFTFVYAGQPFTTVGVDANGFIRMGNTSVNSYSVLSSSNTYAIGGFSEDFYSLGTTTGRDISYTTTGTSPNQVFTVQWTNWGFWSSGSNDFNFQIKLFQGSNLIQFVYGPQPLNSASAQNPQVGLTGASNADFLALSNASGWATPTTAATNFTTMTYSSTSLPTSGLTYTFTPPSCLSPTGVMATATGTTTGSISFSAPSPVPSGGYQYEVRTSGAPGSGATGLVTSGNIPTGTSTTVSGLTAATTYTVYVRSNCGTTFGAWTPATTFTTQCTAFNAPYVESFNTATTPNCWSNPGTPEPWYFNQSGLTGSPNPDYAADNITDHTGNSGYFAWVDGSGTGTNTGITLTSPVINITTVVNPRLRFYVFSQNSTTVGNNLLRIEGLNGSTWILLDSIKQNLGTSWFEKTVSLSAITSATTQIRFVVNELNGVPAGFSAFYNDILIDDVNIEATPTCNNPTSVMASAVTATGATISWTAAVPPPANGYAYEVRTSGAPGSGATGLAASGNVPTGTSASITGLTGVTTYQVYVRSVCSGTAFSTWSQGTFTTSLDCSGATSITSCGILQTASIPAGTGAYNPVQTPTGIAPYGTPGVEKLYTFTATTSGVYTLDVTTTSSAYVDYFIKPAAGSCSNTNWLFIDDIFNPAQSTNNLTLVAGTQYFILLDPEGTSAVSQTFRILCPPTCGQPNTITATAITTTSASIGWTQPAVGTPAQWQISYGPGITTPTAGTSVFVTTNPAPITGLTPATSYNVYVRAICGPGDSSQWSAVYTFQTQCTAFTLPFAEDFSGSTFLPTCWSRATGSLNATSVLTPTTFNGWFQDGYMNVGFTGAASINLWLASKRDWMITPSIDLGSVTPANYVVEFNMGVTQYSNTTPDTLGSDDTVAVVVSYDNGATWNINNALRVWTAADDTLAGQRFYFPITASGQIQIGFYGSEGTVDDAPDNLIFIDSVRVSQCIAPTVNLGNDTTLCGTGSTLTLNSGPGTSRIWSTGDTSQSIIVTQPGSYSVTVFNGGPGCFRRDTVNVTTGVLPVVNLGPDTNVCGNVMSFQLNAGNPLSSYVWSSPVQDLSMFSTQVIDLGPIINAGNINNSGSLINTAPVIVAVTNPTGCTGRDTVNVSVIFTARVSDFTITGTDPTFDFTPVLDSFATSYAWTFGDGGTSALPTPSHTYNTNGAYTVRLVVGNQCGMTDTVTKTRQVTNDINDVTADGTTITLYPNPTAADAVLAVDGSAKLRGYQILNAAGAVVAERLLENGVTRATLNTTAFAPGIYTLRIQLDKGVVVRKLEVLK